MKQNDQIIRCDCGEIYNHAQFERMLWVCQKCGAHGHVTVDQRIQITVEPKSFAELWPNLRSSDPLQFLEGDYASKLAQTISRTGQQSAIRTGTAKIGEYDIALFVLDFSFLGGTLSPAEGEKMCRLFELAADQRLHVVGFSQSGGARMHEGLFSLMQMAKTAATIAQFNRTNLAFISILCNPCLGGVPASFASLGDLIFAEPGAQIGLSGTRVQSSVHGNEKELQRTQVAEARMEQGHIDSIVTRAKMRTTLQQALAFCTPS